MTYLIFETPGLIDIRAFTTFGVNAKVTTNPFGFFGTGLKYAVAVTARLGGTFRVFVDGVEYEFYVKQEKFRDKEFGFLHMRKRKTIIARWGYEKLSYTTELGKNWHPWQVFRELESNTRDENGSTYVLEENTEISDFFNSEKKGKTFIVLDQPEILEAYREDTVFLKEEDPFYEDSSIQIFNKPSESLYYRGVRVSEVGDSMFTYNIKTEMRLTEDRTLENRWIADYWIATSWAKMDGENDDKKILSVLHSKEKYESNLPFDSLSFIPSKTFIRAAASAGLSGRVIPRAATYIDAYVYPPKKNFEDEKISITLSGKEWQDILETIRSVEIPVDDINKLQPLIDQFSTFESEWRAENEPEPVDIDSP